MKAAIRFIFIVLTIFMAGEALAANQVPSSADVGRFGADRKQLSPSNPPKYLPSPSGAMVQGVKVPEQAKNIKFVLKNVVIEGVTAFKPEEISSIYAKHIDQKVSLDVAWEISAAITRHYQDKGYFLSQAIVPQQEIGKGGILKIRVVEGYIGEVDTSGIISKNYVINRLVERLRAEKPANITTTESILLQLNDVPGFSFRSVIEPIKDGDGAVKVLLISEKKKGTGQVSFDNYNSMYLGPYEASVSYDTSLVTLNKTSVSIVKSTPIKKLQFFNVSNDFTILPGLVFGVYGGHTQARPGYTLETYNIQSFSDDFGVSLSKQFIRQRQRNFIMKVKLEGKNVSSDILAAPLTRDNIRTAALNLAYDSSDLLNGYDFLNITVTKGITGLGASKLGDANLSRRGVDPEFQKVEINLNRFQSIGKYFMSVASTAMQFSSGALYSSEQFGYGGQAFGRAYDSSEISGDKGMNAGLELRYIAIPAIHNFSFVPYVFYDVGKVWSVDSVSTSRNSIGEGIRMDSPSGFAANFTIANPLMHGASTPRYSNHKSPRYLAQISYKF